MTPVDFYSYISCCLLYSNEGFTDAAFYRLHSGIHKAHDHGYFDSL